MRQPKAVSILGSRGIPAGHGGFETLAERLSLFLVDRGWDVTVYCQESENSGTGRTEPLVDQWRGIRRVVIATSGRTPLSTVEFDWACTRHAAGQPGIKLVLGYNTAAFAALLRSRGHTVVIHMDGVEWKRPKWSWPVKIWFYANFHCAKSVGRALIADHPELVEAYTRVYGRHKTEFISYGGDPVGEADIQHLDDLGLTAGRYFILISRIEPDNQVLEIVTAFSARRRGFKLAVLGTLDPGNAYHQRIKGAASEEVVFPGAIYDKARVGALRVHARAYLHGHMVGGTNPSLVEALWAGNPIIAHRNRFNLWTAGPNQFFFNSVSECSAVLDEVAADDDAVRIARDSARKWAEENFTWSTHLGAYEALLQDLR